MVITAAFAVSVPGYSQKRNKGKKQTKETKEIPKPPDGIKLEYNFPVDKPMSYSTSTTVEQTMDFNGQSMQANVAIVLACTITSKGKENGNQKLEVRIDTMSQKVDSPQGSSGGIVEQATGKSFTMTLSPNGKELDLSDAEKITFSAEGQESNAAQSFMEYFPNVPEKALKTGDTWVTNDTLKTKSATMSMKQIVKADNKFEGIQTVDGVECAKISATLSGTREQTGENMGMDIAIKGDFTGTAELYFAVKEGYLIKDTANSKMVGTIDISGAQNMSMPLTATMTTTKMLKK